LLDGSVQAENYSVNGGAVFAGKMPCIMVRLMLLTAAIALHDVSHEDQVPLWPFPC